MKAVKISSAGKNREKELIVSEVIEARGFFGKLTGLITRKKLKSFQGFLIKGCNSIHTAGMRYSIDAIFMDKNTRVIKIYSNMKPFKVTPFIKDAFSVLEVRAGVVGKTSLKTGDSVNFEA